MILLSIRSETMARHYSAKDFSWQMPNPLLAGYFQERGMFGDMDFAAMEEKEKP
jgi:hypothetical protein